MSAGAARKRERTPRFRSPEGVSPAPHKLKVGSFDFPPAGDETSGAGTGSSSSGGGAAGGRGNSEADATRSVPVRRPEEMPSWEPGPPTLPTAPLVASATLAEAAAAATVAGGPLLVPRDRASASSASSSAATAARAADTTRRGSGLRQSRQHLRLGAPSGGRASQDDDNTDDDDDEDEDNEATDDNGDDDDDDDDDGLSSEAGAHAGSEGGSGSFLGGRLAPRRWTDEEDACLRRAVQVLGARNWKRIAELVPGRDHVQCLQRWRKALQPGLKKGHWTPEEDERLRLEVSRGARHWGDVAANIPGRTAKQCRERWSNHLDPAIRRSDWQRDEDIRLAAMMTVHGTQWARIAREMQGRTENAVKIRAKSLTRLALRMGIDVHSFVAEQARLQLGIDPQPLLTAAAAAAAESLRSPSNASAATDGLVPIRSSVLDPTGMGGAERESLLVPWTVIPDPGSAMYGSSGVVGHSTTASGPARAAARLAASSMTAVAEGNTARRNRRASPAAMATAAALASAAGPADVASSYAVDGSVTTGSVGFSGAYPRIAPAEGRPVLTARRGGLPIATTMAGPMPMPLPVPANMLMHDGSAYPGTGPAGGRMALTEASAPTHFSPLMPSGQSRVARRPAPAPTLASRAAAADGANRASTFAPAGSAGLILPMASVDSELVMTDDGGFVTQTGFLPDGRSSSLIPPILPQGIPGGFAVADGMGGPVGYTGLEASPVVPRRMLGHSSALHALSHVNQMPIAGGATRVALPLRAPGSGVVGPMTIIAPIASGSSVGAQLPASSAAYGLGTANSAGFWWGPAYSAGGPSLDDAATMPAGTPGSSGLGLGSSYHSLPIHFAASLGGQWPATSQPHLDTSMITVVASGSLPAAAMTAGGSNAWAGSSFASTPTVAPTPGSMAARGLRGDSATGDAAVLPARPSSNSLSSMGSAIARGVQRLTLHSPNHASGDSPAAATASRESFPTDADTPVATDSQGAEQAPGSVPDEQAETQATSHGLAVNGQRGRVSIAPATNTSMAGLAPRYGGRPPAVIAVETQSSTGWLPDLSSPTADGETVNGRMHLPSYGQLPTTTALMAQHAYAMSQTVYHQGQPVFVLGPGGPIAAMSDDYSARSSAPATAFQAAVAAGPAAMHGYVAVDRTGGTSDDGASDIYAPSASTTGPAGSSSASSSTSSSSLTDASLGPSLALSSSSGRIPLVLHRPHIVVRSGGIPSVGQPTTWQVMAARSATNNQAQSLQAAQQETAALQAASSSSSSLTLSPPSTDSSSAPPTSTLAAGSGATSTVAPFTVTDSGDADSSMTSSQSSSSSVRPSSASDSSSLHSARLGLPPPMPHSAQGATAMIPFASLARNNSNLATTQGASQSSGAAAAMMMMSIGLPPPSQSPELFISGHATATAAAGGGVNPQQQQGARHGAAPAGAERVQSPGLGAAARGPPAAALSFSSVSSSGVPVLVGGSDTAGLPLPMTPSLVGLRGSAQELLLRRHSGPALSGGDLASSVSAGVPAVIVGGIGARTSSQGAVRSRGEGGTSYMLPSRHGSGSLASGMRLGDPVAVEDVVGDHDVQEVDDDDDDDDEEEDDEEDESMTRRPTNPVGSGASSLLSSSARELRTSASLHGRPPHQHQQAPPSSRIGAMGVRAAAAADGTTVGSGSLPRASSLGATPHSVHGSPSQSASSAMLAMAAAAAAADAGMGTSPRPSASGSLPRPFGSWKSGQSDDLFESPSLDNDGLSSESSNSQRRRFWS